MRAGPGRVSRTALWAALLTAAAGGLNVAFFRGTHGARVFQDLSELVAAAAAAGCAAGRARRSAGRESAAWWLLGLASGSWALGETVWSYYEVWQGSSTPFPSTADLGFLLFPVLASAALVVHPTQGGALERGRRALDAVMTTLAMVVVFWETVLTAVVQAGAENRFALAVSLAYPVGDLLVLVLTVLTLTRLQGGRWALRLVAVGLVALSASDTGFAYLVAAGTYHAGLVDLGWLLGFVLLALAALVRDTTGGPVAGVPAGPVARSSRANLLPYLPVLVALLVTVVRDVVGQTPTVTELLLSCGVVALLLSRQYLALAENLRLTARLAVREAELRHQAFHDSLTGLANRSLFQDRLSHALELHARDLRPVAVLFLDLDDFKVVNDTLGHQVGDALLVRVAERLLGAVRHGDSVARLGGDEFAVLIEDGGDPVLVAQKVSDSLRAPFTLCGRRVHVAASVGVLALGATDRSTTADELISRADTAMYAAKRAGKDRLALYHEGMSLLELSDQRTAAALERDIEAGRLALAYQPIFELETGRVHSLEALARWRHDGQDVPPDVFIPVAERTGLMTRLTDYVLDLACRELAGWSGIAGCETLSVAVNVPPRQLVAAGFPARVADLLAVHGLRPAQLVLEVTESGQFEDPAHGRQAIACLRAGGLRVSLDDFGTGYSTLAQLSSMQFDCIKIDRSFIQRLDDDAQQVALLQALLQLARSLDLDVVVEGVERPQQLAELRRLGGRLGQGFLMSRPLAPDAVRALLHAGPAERTGPAAAAAPPRN